MDRLTSRRCTVAYVYIIIIIIIIIIYCDVVERTHPGKFQ